MKRPELYPNRGHPNNWDSETNFTLLLQRTCKVGVAVHLLEEETHQQRNHQQITTEEGEGRSGSQTNSTQALSGNTTKWWRNYSEQTTEQEQEKSLQTLYTRKNELQHNLPTPAQQKTRGGGQTDPQITSWWERLTKERPNKNQKPKTYTEPT